MKIEKTPSGTYRVRHVVNGRRRVITYQTKPTQKQVFMDFAAMEEEENRSSEARTFEQCAEEFFKMRSAVCSPSTLTGYKSCLRNLSDTFKSLPMQNITPMDVQVEINRHAANGLSAKTVANRAGLITTVIKAYIPDFRFSHRLPEKRDSEEFYIPTEDDIKNVLEKLEGSEYELPFLLACMGLRRSEICALTAADLNGNTLTINKAIVQGPDKQWIIKSTKTGSSTRKLKLPNYIVDKIRSKGYIYNGSPHTLWDNFRRAQVAAGVHPFSMHKCRHFFASSMNSLGIPDVYIQKMGGWKNNSVLKKVYTHAQKDKEEEMNEFGVEYIMETITP